MLTLDVLTKVITPSFISLIGDPWLVATTLTSCGPQINVVTTGCSGAGRASPSVGQQRCGLITKAVIANGKATWENGA